MKQRDEFKIPTYNTNPVLLRSEQVARLAVQHDLSGSFWIFDGADEILIATQEVGEDDAKHDRREAAADESLPGLLGAQLDERRFAEEEAEHVRHDVVANNHHDGHDEPDHS